VRRAWYIILRALSVDEPKFQVDYEPEEEEVVQEEVLGPWHPKAIEMIETIWGKGFNMPGGPQHVLTLAKPFALDNQMNLLDISSGMGGGTIAVSSQFGCYATLLENVPELAEISQRNIDMSEVRSKIKLQEFDPAKIVLKANSFDCILTREFLFRVEDKTRMLQTIKRAMRMYGQLSLTDFMLDSNKEPSPSLKKWIESDPFPIHLWSVDRYEQEIEALGLDVRVSENISKEYHLYMTRAFQSFIDRYQDGKIRASKNQLPILMGEVERWARLAALLESGEVKLHRYFALKPVKA
jgi:ubiquinone/menaquinone biosynthesis C-methylase UbiE